ncbi:MAG: carboxypeptidase-like regulatory domain-containing protein [Bacteroidales bacterium]|nr:carboxypeptidase-like regulatory domain-containing protein [Candidatus Liminaster caballi]
MKIYLRLRILLLVLTGVLLSSVAVAQPSTPVRITVSGFVTDSLSGERLEFITLQEKSTTNGTITGTDGSYSLLLRSNGILVVSCVGYKTKEINVGTRTHKLNVQLVPTDYQLSEVEVRPRREHYRRRNNPSVELARNVIRHMSDSALTDHDFYTCERYENTTYSLNNFDGPIYRSWQKKFPDIDQYIDTAYSGSVILPASSDENIERLYYQRDPRRERSIQLGQRHVGLDEMLPPDIIGKVQAECFPEIDINEKDIYMFTNKFVNPLTPFAIAFYKFYILDTLTVDTGQKVIDLGFAPLVPEYFGFIGHLYVDADSSYFLRKVEFNLPPDININFVRNMRFTLEQDRLADGTRVVTRKKFESEMTVVGETTGLFAQREMVYSKYSFDAPDDEGLRLLSGRTPRIVAEDVTMRDDAFWDEHREGESQPRGAQVSSMMDAMRQVPFFKYTEMVLTWLFKGYVPLTKQPFEENKFLFGPVNTLASYNSFEGLRTRVGGITTARLNPHWFGYGFVAYGTKDQRFKYDARLEYSLRRCKRHSNEFPINKFSAEYSFDTHLLGQDPSTSKDNFLLSVKRDDAEKITYSRRADLTYRREFHGGFSYMLQGTWQREYSTAYAPFELVGATAPPPTPWGVHHYDMTMAHARLRYAPHETFVEMRLTRTPINHQHPIFTLDHTSAAKGVLGSDFDYHRTEFTFQKRFWFSAFGYIDAYLNAGKIWSQSPYALLAIPNSNLGFTIQSHAFSQLNAMEFVADQYAHFELEYYLNGWVFNSLPLLKRLKWREVLTFRGYYGSLSDKNNPAAVTADNQWLNPGLYRFPSGGRTVYASMPDGPYMEAAVGIENIFKVLRIDYIRRLNYYNHENVARNGFQLAVHITF